MNFDALRFLKDYNIQYWQEGKNVSPGWTNIQCPFHEDSNHGGFKNGTDWYNCWKCKHHFLDEVVQKLLGVDRRKAKEIISEYQTDESPIHSIWKRKKAEASSIELPGDLLNTTIEGSTGRRYVKKRGFDPDYLTEKYKLRSTSFFGDWKFRLIIPFYFKERVVSFQGRDITGKQELRYKTLAVQKSIVDPKHILYNIDNCKKDSVFVVEGAFDVFRMGDNFVATLGTSLTEYQIKLLAGYKRIVFIFDPEKEAQDRAREYASRLSALGRKVEIVDLEMDKDPGDLTEKEAQKIKKELGADGDGK